MKYWGIRGTTIQHVYRPLLENLLYVLFLWGPLPVLVIAVKGVGKGGIATPKCQEQNVLRRKPDRSGE